ncbi:TPA: hypothetical protein L6I57_004329 [Salmonella enterica subsp. enterica serovar Infantis]|nr:hypothetical protein [Salmonella enterica subsp. enterica serovar Infantis]HBP8226180.1 hypothetical protein [Salmonella enterica subsp. enterica serovar Infantis]
MAQSIALQKQPKIVMTDGNDVSNNQKAQPQKRTILSMAGKAVVYLLMSIIGMLWSISRPIIDKLLGVMILGSAAGAYLFHHSGNDKAFFITLGALVMSVVIKALMYGRYHR